MSARRHIGNPEYLTKRIPQNPRYQHVKSRLDTVSNSELITRNQEFRGISCLHPNHLLLSSSKTDFFFLGCLSVSYQLPSIARLCHEWAVLLMQSLAAFCSVSSAGFSCVLKHPLWLLFCSTAG
uniref:Centrosomal protein 41 n=1 Tax=Molossus molossus TaxID=27622 RepID=A0A7J8H9T6_MOLMO|nr:centrosomal protein 41 [Molossus molossus]